MWKGIAVFSLLAAGAASASAQPKIEATLEIAPQWTTLTPLDYSEVTDATAVTANFKASQRIVPGLKGSGYFSPSARLDSDSDDPDRGSYLGFGGELETEPQGGFTLFAGYGWKEKFTEVFGAASGDEGIFSSGVRFAPKLDACRPKSAGSTEPDCIKFQVSPSYSRTNSSSDAQDNKLLQAKADLTVPLVHWAALSVSAVRARRDFLEVNPVANIKERRSELGFNGGFDFSPLLRAKNVLGPLSPFLKKLVVGYAYAKRNSNIDGNDKDSESPSFSIMFGRTFE